MTNRMLDAASAVKSQAAVIDTAATTILGLLREVARYGWLPLDPTNEEQVKRAIEAVTPVLAVGDLVGTDPATFVTALITLDGALQALTVAKPGEQSTLDKIAAIRS